jgi:hypothetical protein
MLSTRELCAATIDALTTPGKEDQTLIVAGALVHTMAVRVSCERR